MILNSFHTDGFVVSQPDPPFRSGWYTRSSRFLHRPYFFAMALFSNKRKATAFAGTLLQCHFSYILPLLLFRYCKNNTYRTQPPLLLRPLRHLINKHRLTNLRQLLPAKPRITTNRPQPAPRQCANLSLFLLPLLPPLLQDTTGLGFLIIMAMALRIMVSPTLAITDPGHLFPLLEVPPVL